MVVTLVGLRAGMPHAQFQIFGDAFRMAPQRVKNSKNLTAVGFEPTRIAPPELESGALDRSAKLSCAQYGVSMIRRLSAILNTISCANLRLAKWLVKLRARQMSNVQK